MTSENGWPTLNGTSLDRSPFPGTNVVPVPGVRPGDVATVLHEVGRQFNETVAPLYNPGCWGYAAPVPIPGTSIISNHGSGTAIDLNAPSFPWQTRNMTNAQREACRRIVNHMDGLVAWGGDFTTRVDEMHFEINGSAEEIADLANRIKGVDMIPDREHLDLVFQRFHLKNSDKGEQEKWIGKRTYTELLDVLVRQQAYFDAVKKQEIGEVAFNDNWQERLEKLQAEGSNKEVKQLLEEILKALKK